MPGARRRDPLIWEADRDVRTIHAHLRGDRRLDRDRVAVVAASYSGEEALEAARDQGAFASAYVLLSPGSLSDLSIESLGSASDFDWLYLASEEERQMQEITPRIPRGTPRGDIHLLPGRSHASGMLETAAELEERIGAWLVDRLRPEP